MSAKEMFEKLGYKRFENNYWMYFTKGANSTYPVDRISFIKKKKEIEIERFTHHKTLVKNITISELQAINKQVEELGWLDVKN